MKKNTELSMGPEISNAVVHYDIEVPQLDDKGNIVTEERNGRLTTAYEKKKVSVSATYNTLASSDHGLNTLGNHGSMNILAFDAGINFKNLPRDTAAWSGLLSRKDLIAILPKSIKDGVTDDHT